MSAKDITLIVAVNNRKVLSQNLLRSPAITNGMVDQLLIQEGFRSAGLAYNQAIDASLNDLLVFVHQDIYLPNDWLSDMHRAIHALDDNSTPWGVLGSFGSSRARLGGSGQVYTTGLGLHGNAITAPEPVDSLDEIVLVIRKSSGLRFDPHLPHFHLYGADICLAARSIGLENYAIPAFCIHNTNQLRELPTEFYQCYRYIKSKWKKALPIYTSCMTISRFDREFHKKKISELMARVSGQCGRPTLRVEDPTMLWSPPCQTGTRPARPPCSALQQGTS